MYYIGIDGGGTKTDFCILDENGTLLGRERMGSASYKQIGMDNLLCLLKDGSRHMRELVKAPASECVCCAGIPNYGESQTEDELLHAHIAEAYSSPQIKIVNDGEVGLAASLLLNPGINLVAGTGSIAVGLDRDGNTVRAGGWSEWFSDEGSGRWLGMKCMELFSKESDGRMPRGALLDLVRQTFSLKNDMDVIDIFEKQYQSNRDKVASLQRVLLQAAQTGDRQAIDIYAQAAHELSLIVRAVYQKIYAGETIMFSCSGGLFQTGGLLKEPLMRELSDCDLSRVSPGCDPVIGAALLARRQWKTDEGMDQFIKNATKKSEL